MARITKPQIRKIKSLKKTEALPDSEEVATSTKNEGKSEIHVTRPETTFKVTNPDKIDKKTENALHTEEAVLFQTKSIFPLDMIPNELIIKEKSVSIKWNFILNSNTQTMLIKDIGYVTISDNRILAALVISYKSPLENIEIRNLHLQSAYEAKSIIEKLMIQINEGGLDKKPEDDSMTL
ncbi:MAG: hypothetical protein M3Q44_04760 [bacterium]|nr:hypothetical protein [bacterium]